jgi:hypothetical protein
MGNLVNRAAIERKAIDVVTHHGGRVGFDWHDTKERREAFGNALVPLQKPNSKSETVEAVVGTRQLSIWHRLFGFLGEEYFQRITCVYIPRRSELATRGITPGEAMQLARLRNLQSASLQSPNAPSLLALSHSKSIKKLIVTDGELDREMVDGLASFGQLQELQLLNCRVSKEDVRYLQVHLPSCKIGYGDSHPRVPILEFPFGP